MKEEIALILSADIEIEDHDCLIPNIVLKYESGEQSFCPIIDGPTGGFVLKALLKAANVYKLSQLPGKNVIAVIEDGYIKGIKPLPCNKGTAFNLSEFNHDNS